MSRSSELPAQKIRSGPRTIVKSLGPPPFQRFLDAYRDDVWRLLITSVGREDAEDCFQETFISALRAYPKLRTRAREHNLRAWILTIAHNKALDAHRARARGALPIEPETVANIVDRNGRPGSSGRDESSSGAPSAALHDQDLWDAVHALPDRQRSAVILRFTADLPHRDIAAAIGCSEEAARRSLHEGLTRLRKEVAI
jgi:RNA polymerase sigma factor (sigma-70 family)